MEKESALRKIRALLAKSNATTGEEAEAFGAKAAELMARWAIEKEELGEDAIRREIGRVRFTVKYLNPWRRAIVSELGQACQCYTIFTIGHPEVQCYGMPESTQLVHDTFFFIEKQVVLVARSLFPKSHTQARRAEAGLGLAVALKIRKSWEYGRQSAGGRSLITTELAQGEALARSMVEVRNGKSLRFDDTSEFRVGKGAADAVQIRGEVQ